MMHVGLVLSLSLLVPKYLLDWKTKYVFVEGFSKEKITTMKTITSWTMTPVTLHKYALFSVVTVPSLESSNQEFSSPVTEDYCIKNQPSRNVLVLLLIGWITGAKFLSQSLVVFAIAIA